MFELPIFNEETVNYETFFMDAPGESNVREEVDEILKCDAIEEALDTLFPREKEVLISRYWHKRTLEHTGRLINVSRERTRQIEWRAIRKLRHPLRADKLSHFYFDDTCGYKKYLYEEGRELRKRIKEYISSYPLQPEPEPEPEEKRYTIPPLTAEDIKHRNIMHWWDGQLGKINAMKSLKHPAKEFHGKCSCSEWKATYNLPIERFDCLCGKCHEVFEMKSCKKHHNA